ncbi:unnamed protein product [Bemisia tabaci]|uniref:Uncharacterized protein n=1 Tax=Bemisia tabaci TaxID=7038 RepID=A0A9P0AHC7_BEMTA|nr:unnamed protein product [Bemisia tabaci]
MPKLVSSRRCLHSQVIEKMARWIELLAVSLLLAVSVRGTCDCPAGDCTCIAEDPLGYDARFEICHLFTRQAPHRVAISSTGRKFVCFPCSFDAQNTNDGCNGKIQVAEVTPNGELPYPNYCINNPPRGVINRACCPAAAFPYADFFISVESLKILNDYLWCMDSGRPLDCTTQVLLEATGGTKVVVINTCSNSVVRIYELPLTVALPTSLCKDIAIDTCNKKAYIADAGCPALIVLDIVDGTSYRLLAGDPSVSPVCGNIAYVWGQAQYWLTKCGDCTTVGFIPYGIYALALSPDCGRLYFIDMGDRKLYSVCTSSLQTPGAANSDILPTLINHGEVGKTLGLAADCQTGVVWFGNAEANAVGYFNPCCPFSKTNILIRDKRVAWSEGVCIPGDGYCYIIDSHFNGIPSIYPGTGPLFSERRKCPFVLWRFKLPCAADLCPNPCAPATLGYYPPGGCTACSVCS